MRCGLVPCILPPPLSAQQLRGMTTSFVVFAGPARLGKCWHLLGESPIKASRYLAALGYL